MRQSIYIYHNTSTVEHRRKHKQQHSLTSDNERCYLDNITYIILPTPVV